MACLIKPKEYNWKDFNLELFGSDLEREIKKSSAETEPAWKNAGTEVGLQIWRIVQFKVTEWPKEDYGKFYSGDSYIVLNTYKIGKSFGYDVHFWIGRYSTQDEYGTAAYKTVELDTFLDDVPIQHREVQGHESTLFKSYFPCITILQGGAESGFRHVKPEEYKPRLFHFHGDRRGVTVKEVPRSLSRLDSGDVFILDLGLTIYQWNGKGSNKDERFKAVEYLEQLKKERMGKAHTETLDEGFVRRSHEMFKHLREQDDKDSEGSDCNYQAANPTKELYRLSDATGKMTFTLEKSGSMSKSDLDPADVFILDAKSEVFVWIGSKTTQAEKKNAMTFAHNYLMGTDHPLVPVTCLPEGCPSVSFETAIAA